MLIVFVKLNMYITGMTTLIKTKFNISDDQKNIEKYRLAANIKLLWFRKSFEVNFNIGFGIQNEFPS